MYTVGIDLGGTNIAVGICDEDLNIVIKGSVPTLASREPELIVKDMAALVDTLCEKAGITHADVAYAPLYILYFFLHCVKQKKKIFFHNTRNARRVHRKLTYLR